MKMQLKKVVGNTATTKVDTQELKVSVARIDTHMLNYNEGMKNLSNYVKV